MSPSSWPYPVSNFQCHRCGNCCRGDGFVELKRKDILRAAEYLGLTREEFLDRYCTYDKKEGFWILRDQEDVHQSCIFLNPDNSCQIHEAKPEQCAGFPMKWRPGNIADFCEGWRAMAGLPPPEKKKTMTEE